VLAATQLLGFLVAGIAMTAPDFSRLIRDWSGATIYPEWAALYVLVGVVASGVSILRGRARALMMPTLSVVMAAQLAGLGLVAVKHWNPSFGMGGGYAGEPDELVKLAWIIGIAGTIATVAAIAQLVGAEAFPVRTSVRDAIPFVGVGTLIVLLLPFGIAEGDSELQDLTSIGAFVLIYSAPIGLTVAGAAWVLRSLRVTAIASCAVAAGLSALDLVTDLSFLHGRPALLATAVLLVALAVAVAWSSRSIHPRAEGAHPHLTAD
jgi:hypothetical protein